MHADLGEEPSQDITHFIILDDGQSSSESVFNGEIGAIFAFGGLVRGRLAVSKTKSIPKSPLVDLGKGLTHSCLRWAFDRTDDLGEE